MALTRDSSVNTELYTLDGEERAFFKLQTGIEDDEALKQHVVSVAAKAYEVFKYGCIQNFGFLRFRMTKLPTYPRVLELGSTRKGAILLDIGCCFGNDIRRAVADGYPVQNVIASDLRQDFWELGHALFRSTPATFPVAFVPGDAFDSSFIAVRGPFLEPPKEDAPPLGSVTSLTPLQGHISVIHASAFFHLFREDQQTELARKLASLLSPLPGSIIFGAHRGLPDSGEAVNGREEIIFCHSPESWEKMWNGVIFPKGSVKVETGLKERVRGEGIAYGLWWSVTRL